MQPCEVHQTDPLSWVAVPLSVRRKPALGRNRSPKGRPRPGQRLGQVEREQALVVALQPLVSRQKAWDGLLRRRYGGAAVAADS